MPLNTEDIRNVMAERDASPERYRSFDPNDRIMRFGRTTTAPAAAPDMNRTTTAQSGSSASSVELAEIRAAARNRGLGMTRSATLTSSINTLERHPTALGRIETHRTQHERTVGATQVKTHSKDLPAFGAGKPYPPDLPEREEYVVEFDGHDDPLHAQNWPMKTKLFIGTVVAFDSLTATVGSSIFSNATQIVSRTYHVNSEVGILATSFFVLGYAFGPIMWGPMSELYGRRLPIIISGFGFSIFAIAVATAENLQTILICRFFGGIFGSCPLAVVGAIFADMFDNKSRGLALAVFSATVFIGPLVAPFIGGFIVDSYLGWRWTEYISAIMGFLAWGLCIIFLKETYPPIILVNKASELRRRTRNWGIHAKQEEIEVDFRELVSKNVSRPFRILFTEPIVLLVSIYMSFIYGLLYLFLTAYSVVFQGIYGMNRGVGGLPYFGMVAGELLGFAAIVLLNKSYVKKLEGNHGIPVPEWRLPVAIAGGVSFAVGLFWFGWTGWTRDIPWIVPTLSGLLTGFGIFTIFIQLLNYIVDAYLMFAASAIAANTFLRSLFGCIFPLFATYMFDSVLGVKYTLTLLGGVAALLVPMPILFLLYGRKIRARSKMAPALDLKMGAGAKDEEKGEVDDNDHEGDTALASANPTRTRTGTSSAMDNATRTNTNVNGRPAGAAVGQGGDLGLTAQGSPESREKAEYMDGEKEEAEEAEEEEEEESEERYERGVLGKDIGASGVAAAHKPPMASTPSGNAPELVPTTSPPIASQEVYSRSSKFY